MKQVQKNYFTRYIVTDEVCWCNVEQFIELFQKLYLQIYAVQFMTS